MEGWEAVELREAACEWAAHLHDEPQDWNDTACRQRWARLARAAYQYARSRSVGYGRQGGSATGKTKKRGGSDYYRKLALKSAKVRRKKAPPPTKESK